MANLNIMQRLEQEIDKKYISIFQCRIWGKIMHFTWETSGLFIPGLNLSGLSIVWIKTLVTSQLSLVELNLRHQRRKVGGIPAHRRRSSSLRSVELIFYISFSILIGSVTLPSFGSTEDDRQVERDVPIGAEGFRNRQNALSSESS